MGVACRTASVHKGEYSSYMLDIRLVGGYVLVVIVRRELRGNQDF